ncbi:hypothetical protein ACFVDU_12730 [Streptomyces albidoflavus]
MKQTNESAAVVSLEVIDPEALKRAAQDRPHPGMKPPSLAKATLTQLREWPGGS